MATDKKKPLILLALAFLLFAGGGFLILVKVGVDSRERATLTAGFGSRTAPEAAARAKASVIDDLKAGAKVAAAKLDGFTGGLFGWGEEPSTAPGGGYTASRSGSGSEGGDSFEQYYKKNYAAGESDGWNTDSWEEPASGGGSSFASGGGASFSGGSSGGSTFSPRRGKATDDGWADPAMQKAGLGGKKGAKDASSQAAARQTAADREQPTLFASAAGGFSRLNTGGAQNTNTSQEWAGGRGGAAGAGKALEGMRGGAAAADLGGAAESSKSGGMADFGSKMAGGAAAIKAGSSSGGSSVPSASGPSDKSSSSSGSSDSSSGGSVTSGSSGDKTGGDTADKTEDKTSPETKSPLVNSASSDEDNGDDAPVTSFFGSVVKTYGNGEKVKDEDGKSDVTGQPNEALLQQGGIITARAELLASTKRGATQTKASADPDTDPVNFSDLSAQRQKQLKRRMMAFLRRVDMNYGGKKYMEAKTCEQDPVTCNANGLTEGYIDMATYKETDIKVSYKYSESKWRLYTIGFTAPESLRRAVKRQAAAE